MYFSLLKAIKLKQEKIVLSLLTQMIEQSLLTDDQLIAVAQNLVLNGLLNPIKLFVRLASDKLILANEKSNKLLIIAIIYNRTDIIKYLLSEDLVAFPTPLHRAAYLDEIKEPIDASEAEVSDSKGLRPVIYAASAGRMENVLKLRAVMPESSFKQHEILIQLLVNKHFHLLPQVIPRQLLAAEAESIISVAQQDFLDPITPIVSFLNAFEDLEARKSCKQQLMFWP